MVHAGYCGYWWELYRTVLEAAPDKAWLLDGDLGELIKVSEEIAGTAEIIGIDSTPMVKFLLQAEECYYGTGSTLPVAESVLEIWMVRVRLATAERERTNSTQHQPTTALSANFPSVPALSEQTPSPLPFDFSEFKKPPVVNGNTKRMLTQAEHDILVALLEAGPRGLTKDELDEKSGHTEARKYLGNSPGKTPTGLP